MDKLGTDGLTASVNKPARYGISH